MSELTTYRHLDLSRRGLVAQSYDVTRSMGKFGLIIDSSPGVPLLITFGSGRRGWALGWVRWSG